MNGVTFTCKHTSQIKLQNGKERCRSCGEERWIQGIRNAIRDEECNVYFGRGITETDVIAKFKEMRRLGAFISTSTIYDPIRGVIFEATAYIFYQGNQGPILSVSSSVSEYYTIYSLTVLVKKWYGVE